MSSAAVKLAINRRATQRFIDDDPTTITLIPTVIQTRPGGAEVKTDGSPRNAQVFKIIYKGEDGIVLTEGGTTRRFDFVLVAAHDAVVSIGDHWSESTASGTQSYSLEYELPDNGYERKFGGRTHGAEPQHG